MPRKARADSLVFAQGLADSIAHAASLVMAGRVAIQSDRFDPEKVDKPGRQFPEHTRFILLPGKIWASRGALKLLTALETGIVSVEGKVCVDAGASTGGFTDCLLAHGAKRVYAIDVGRNLLHEKLRHDQRVISMEGINLRNASAGLLPEKADFLAADLSFISLTACVPNFLPWLKPNAALALLIKPQFELAPNEMVRGVVRDEIFRKKAMDKVIGFCTENCRLDLLCQMPSRIKGPKGNQEYIAIFKMPAERSEPA